MRVAPVYPNSHKVVHLMLLFRSRSWREVEIAWYLTLAYIRSTAFSKTANTMSQLIGANNQTIFRLSEYLSVMTKHPSGIVNKEENPGSQRWVSSQIMIVSWSYLNHRDDSLILCVLYDYQNIFYGTSAHGSDATVYLDKYRIYTMSYANIYSFMFLPSHLHLHDYAGLKR